ncbi:MAG: hypothetical protein HY658_12845 [Actinobacteria bacterium]|nr:hypothetical protein [Actinomycetota bacterium]
MRRYLKLLALAGVFTIVAAACNTGGDTVTTTTPPPTDGETTAAPELQRGGTLNMAMLSDDGITYDPQKEYYSVTWSVFRCCLLRTLMSYRGAAADEGGTEVLPDLAAEPPTVSADGLTWTFKIREGVTYAPPLQDVEITAQDFIRALEREFTPEAGAAYPFYYSIIEGTDAFNEGEADTISGLTAVDDKTLEVKLTTPAGDLPFRFAMPATAPIPEGVTDGHDEDYGRFLVASGPYMFQGADLLDFTAAPADQAPVAGFDPGRAHVLVRNPSWGEGESDPLRGEFAYADEINIAIGGTEEDAAAKIDNGELDYLIDGVHPADQVQRYRTTPDLQARIFIHPSDAVRYLSMNVASPPFDDVHVRRSINLATDKDGLRRLRPGGELAGEIAEHIMVPGVLGDLLADYAPYATANGQGDIEAAQAEMAQSKYDTNGDGSCEESPECNNVLAVTDEGDPYPDQAALLSENYAPLGITLDIKQFDRGTMYDKCNDPASHTTFCLAPGWGKDYANATTFAEPLFGNASLGPDSCCNYALVGATAEQLAEWGYDAPEVPSIEDKLAECNPLQGDEQTQCFAELDQLLMEEVVPWVPYLFDNNIDIVSENVLNYHFDQFAGLGAYEKFAIASAQA